MRLRLCNDSGGRTGITERLSQPRRQPIGAPPVPISSIHRIARRTARTSRTPGIAARLPAGKQDDVRSEGAFALSFGRRVGSRLPRCQPHIQGLNEARDQVQGDTVHFLNGFFRQIRLVLADIVQCKDHVDRRCGFSLTAIDNPFPCVGACQWRSKKGPPRRCKKGPLGGCGLVPVVHGRAPRATRRALNRPTRRRAREGPVGPRGQAWVGWSVQFAVGV